MDILVLKPKTTYVEWTLFAGGRRRAVMAGGAGSCRGEAEARKAMADVALRVEGAEPDTVAVRMPYGGADFTGPVPATDDALARLNRAAVEAPLHLPPAIACARAARERFNVPVVLCFETAFFADLPERERLYALDSAGAGVGGLRRWGYHGIFHEAACRHALRIFRGRKGGGMPRILSVCLEPQPEIASAIGTRAVTVTSGATPLEGLPGRTTCGEIDPSIVLTLAEELKAGPEEVDRILTRESGLAGLVGEPATLDDVFTRGEEKYALAREIMLYRMLLATGSAAAALGGLDAVVFTAGVGENAPRIRAAAAAHAAWLGLEIDPEANASGRGARRISSAASRVAAWVAPTNEELMIARHALRVIRGA